MNGSVIADLVAMTRECYAEAYTSGYDRTVRFLCSRGVKGECAREFAQAAWTRGWERISQLRDESIVLTWVNSIALNSYRAELRKTPKFEPLKDIAGPSEINTAAIDLERLLYSIGPRNRELFHKCLLGSTAKEIAQAQGVSHTAVRLRLLRARREACSRLQRVA